MNDNSLPGYHHRDKRVRRNCIEIIMALRENGPCTCEDLEQLCHLSEAQVHRATKQLREDGCIVRRKYVEEDARKRVYVAQ